jgi:uncharacterized membrane protein
MTATKARNGVLILVAPWRRRVVVLADEGITGKVSPALWSEGGGRGHGRVRQGQFTDGLVAAVERLATALAPHFRQAPVAPTSCPTRSTAEIELTAN